MADIKALKSYLVALGFEVNTGQLAKFEHALKDSAQLVKYHTHNIAGDILKWQFAITGMFVSFGAAVVATVDKVAMADQTYRLFGQQMFMDMQHAKSLKIALDALNQPLENIAFDPELHERFMQLQKDQLVMQRQLGGATFESTMRQMRDIRFEFTRFTVESQYFLMSTAQELFKALGLGSGKFLDKLRSLNEYIIAHIPEWSRMFAQYIAPVLKDVWMILKDVWKVAVDFATLFDNIIGMISGDSTLQGTANFDKFARSLGTVTHWLALVLHFLTKIEGVLVGGAVGGAVGSGIGGIIGGITGGPLGALAGAGTGGLIGSGVGAGAGLLFDLLRGGNSDKGSSLSDVASAVMGVESGGHQTNRFGGTLTSSAGALGRMQLMKGTASDLGVDPNNPQQNELGGRMYLQQMFARYGNWHDALAAYNWGPGHVDRALKAHKAFPSSVEDYVRSVQSRMPAGASVGTHSSVVVGDIHITQPNGTPEQIASVVVRRIQEQQAIQTSRNLNELKSIYG